MGEEVTSLQWDGERALVGGARGSLQLWSLMHARRLWAEERVHDGRITALAVVDCGRGFVSGGEDRRVIVWKVA